MDAYLDIQKDIDALNPYMWQLEALKLNTGDSDWGFEKGDMFNGTGMSQCMNYATWEDFVGKFKIPNEYNMVVNFRFDVEKDHSKCDTCDGTGDHPALRLETEMKEFTEEPLVMDQSTMEWFVQHGHITSPSHGRVYWDNGLNKFKQHKGSEILLISKEDLIYPELKEVNDGLRGNKPELLFSMFKVWDWRNIIQAQRTIKGLPTKCIQCQGTGKRFTGEPRLALTLWYIHPGHSASKAVKIKNIKQTDIDPILTFMQSAWKVLMDKFNPILHIHETNLANIKSVPGRWQDHRQQTSSEGSVDS